MEWRQHHQFGRSARIRFDAPPTQQFRSGGGKKFCRNDEYAVEWSGGNVINLGGLPGAASTVADAINDTGQVVGTSVVGGVGNAVEWSGGSLITLEDLPSAVGSVAAGIA